MEFVRELIVNAQTSANVKYYAEIVQEKATLRKLIKINEEIANICYLENQPLEVILERAEKGIFELVEHGNMQEYTPIKQVVLNALDVIEKASKTKGTVTGIPTGFIDLDYKLSGLQRSDLILIAAKDKKDIRIVAAGHGNRFEDIENQLIGEKGKGWRELIAGAIDNAYDRLVASTPPQTEEEKTHCEMIKEAVKGMFINESRTAAEAEFIKTHIVDYEKIFDVCMNGDDLEFKKGLVRLQKMQNEYVMQREREETANE